LGRDKQPKGRGRMRGAANLTRQANAGHSGDVPGWWLRMERFPRACGKIPAVHGTTLGKGAFASWECPFLGFAKLSRARSKCRLFGARASSEHRSAPALCSAHAQRLDGCLDQTLIQYDQSPRLATLSRLPCLQTRRFQAQGLAAGGAECNYEPERQHLPGRRVAEVQDAQVEINA
jgi:hypothetical protein